MRTYFNPLPLRQRIAARSIAALGSALVLGGQLSLFETSAVDAAVVQIRTRAIGAVKQLSLSPSLRKVRQLQGLLALRQSSH